MKKIKLVNRLLHGKRIVQVFSHWTKRLFDIVKPSFLAFSIPGNSYSLPFQCYSEIYLENDTNCIVIQHAYLKHIAAVNKLVSEFSVTVTINYNQDYRLVQLTW